MAAAALGNGYDPDRVRQCVERIESLDRERERHHMAYMAECAKLADGKKDVYDEAKNAWGIPKRALKTVIKARATERKLEALRADLEGDDQEAYDQIRHALGDLADTPLGRAATGDASDEDLRGTDQKERDAPRKEGGAKRQGKASIAALNAAAGGPDANAAALQAGIKPLHS